MTSACSSLLAQADPVDALQFVHLDAKDARRRVLSATEMPLGDPVVGTSQMYARNASGEVLAVIGSDLRPGNVWQTVELSRLMDNPNVSRVVVIDPDTDIETIVFQR